MALTIRSLSDEDRDSFKQLTGEATAAGALVKAAQIGVSATAELHQARQTIKTLQGKLDTYRQTLQHLTPLCLKVVDLAAQKDIFLEEPENAKN
ncbi:hypothetical protein [Pseudomonas aeruginosa]|uniref:hypothetical protein n=1 Tax=Pseudomonas aeruginosa TaxID=287 RepID=UPI00214D32EC|nr:hypothetical protein [Pseudomonas aeruginosa]MCR3854419.1 hypothetical protein [Pseudomonas aeruginosa]MCS7918890.1 hypothetical protein [Pseudomonas aeruginosa]MCW5356945.1 hypothetical protein [Pseudomonas aeruginosa]